MAADPTIVGHEIVGKVSKRGPKARWQIGERVGVGAHVLACQQKDSCRMCANDQDNLCPKRVFTYNSSYADGEIARGGYAQHVRVHANFAFKIPEELTSTVAAPLLCAGSTMFTPARRYKHLYEDGGKVGIIGMGGLGHLGIQFANKFGGKVYAIGTSKSKEEDAKSLGAAGYIDINNTEEMKSHSTSFRFIMCTANQKGMNWDSFFTLLGENGVFCLLALPEEPLKFNPSSLLFHQCTLTTSLIGSTKDTEDMLAFAAKHGVKPIIEEFPMSSVKEAVKKVVDNKIRYRAVLKN